MKNRILEFLRAENKSSAQFAEEIGVQASSISHIISGRNNPSLDFTMKMLVKYPSLSTDWLLFGSGQMYRESKLNGLFDVDLTKTRVSQEKLTENKINDNLKSLKAGNTGDYGTMDDSNSASSVRKVCRIVFIYNDDTFKEFLPGVE